MAASQVEALRELLERDLGGQEALDDLLPAELEEQSQALVAGREGVVERRPVPRRAEPAIERRRALGVERAVDADRGEPLLDVVEDEAHRRVSRPELLGAGDDEALEVGAVLLELGVARLDAASISLNVSVSIPSSSLLARRARTEKSRDDGRAPRRRSRAPTEPCTPRPTKIAMVTDRTRITAIDDAEAQADRSCAARPPCSPRPARGDRGAVVRRRGARRMAAALRALQTAASRVTVSSVDLRTASRSSRRRAAARRAPPRSARRTSSDALVRNA